MQLRTLWHSLQASQSDGGARISLTLGFLWYAFWGLIAFVLAAVPNLIGTDDIAVALPGLFLFIMGYWQLTPLLTLSMGVSIDMRRTAIYPISQSTLFAVECLLRLGTGAEMLLILTGLWAGLATAGSLPQLTLAAGFSLFVLFNVFDGYPVDSGSPKM